MTRRQLVSRASAGLGASLLLLFIGRIGSTFIAHSPRELDRAQWWMYAVIAGGYACLYLSCRAITGHWIGDVRDRHRHAYEVVHILIMGSIVTAVTYLLLIEPSTAFSRPECMYSSAALAWLTF